MRDGIGWGGDDGGAGGAREFGVTGQWTREGKLWGSWESWETIDLIVTLYADSGSDDLRGRRLECGYWDTTRWVDEAEIGSVEKRDRVRTAISAKDTTTLSTVLMTDRDERRELG